MKKIIFIIAAVLLAAVFAGCSDSSGNDSAVLAALSLKSDSNNYGLPPSVGVNEFAGKTFKRLFEENGIDVFSDNTVKFVLSYKRDGDSKSSPYTLIFAGESAYSYNSVTKRIYKKDVTKTRMYINRTGYKEPVEMVCEGPYSNDEEFVDAMRKYFSILYDLADENYIEACVKDDRVSTFKSYGYTDQTGETPVSAEIIELYNKEKAESDAMDLARIGCYAYRFSGTSLTEKWDDEFYPKGTKLSDFCSLFCRSYLTVSNHGVDTYDFNYGRQFWHNSVAALAPEDESYNLGFYVSSISDSKIYVSKIGVDSESGYIYTETNDEISLEKSETEYVAMYKLTYKDTCLGTITIPYATASNIPEFEGNNVYEYTIIE